MALQKGIWQRELARARDPRQKKEVIPLAKANLLVAKQAKQCDDGRRDLIGC
jgi:hypothetical protein